MTAVRIPDFDLWREGYDGATVTVYAAGTTTPLTLYADPAEGSTLPNPQVLLTRQDTNGDLFGKWAQPVYVNQAYFLSIDTGEQTGQQTPPLIDLAGADVSASLVSGTRGQEPHTLATIADWFIYAHAFGNMGDAVGSAVTTATLNAAIGAAAAQGGGIVRIPAGNFPIEQITLPEGVILQGEGITATTLRSIISDEVIILGGDGTGLKDITLDGVNVNALSIGVSGINKAGTRFEDCIIRRFDTGIRLLGAVSSRWRNFSVSECDKGADLRGDLDTSTTGLGSSFENIEWDGGAVAFHTTYGVRLRAVDAIAQNVRFAALQFEGNLVDGLIIEGARDFRGEGLWFSDGVRGVHIKDNDTTPLPAINTVRAIQFLGGLVDGGQTGMEVLFEGTCEGVAFQRTRFENVSFNLNAPTNAVHLENTTQDANTTSTGLTTFLLYVPADRGGFITGVTSGASSAVAWRETVPPGSSYFVEAKVIGRQRNGTGRGRWWVAGAVVRPGATLPYINLTGSFTLGNIVTGATSGASGRIIANTGTQLTLSDITGNFTNGESITDGTATATTNGTLSTSNAALDAGGSVAVITASEDFAGAPTVAITASGASAEVTVQGDTSLDIDWAVEVAVVKT